MTDFREHVRAAIAILGNQTKLADAVGCSQQAISFLINDAEAISVEMAFKIDLATNGQVSKHALRPDFFGPITQPTPEQAA